jgi:hypothetical protein
MSEKDERYAQGYLEGYEEGLKEAIQEFIAISNRKNFTTAEIRLLMKNQQASVPEKVDERRGKLCRRLGITLRPECQLNEDELDVRVGRGHLFKEEEGATKIFATAACLEGRGWPVLVFTRRPVEDVRSIVGDQAQIYWLSKTEGVEQNSVPREMIIAPTDLTRLQTTYQRFLDANKEKTPVVILDALGYLLTYSDFQTILKLIQSIRDAIYLNKGVLLVSYDPRSLKENQPRLLEQELS